MRDVIFHDLHLWLTGQTRVFTAKTAETSSRLILEASVSGANVQDPDSKSLGGVGVELF